MDVHEICDRHSVCKGLNVLPAPSVSNIINYGLNDWMPQIPEGTGHRSQRDMINSCSHAQRPWPGPCGEEPLYHRHHTRVWAKQGTGFAFGPEPCWVAFAPEWSGMKWVQGRMWHSFRGECDPCFCVAGAIVSEPQKNFLHPRESYSRVMRRSNSHFNQLPGHYGCYGVPLLRCNIHFEQLRRHFGCYVPTAISIN